MKVNGIEREVNCVHHESLADFLRDQGINSVHLGCEHGVCGSCNVFVDGQSVRSCLSFAHSFKEADVITLEGLNDALATQLKESFNRHHALQCGFCTPGVFNAAYDYLKRIGMPDEKKIRQHMAGNICRCTGYQGIIDAIFDVAGQKTS